MKMRSRYPVRRSAGLFAAIILVLGVSAFAGVITRRAVIGETDTLQLTARDLETSAVATSLVKKGDDLDRCFGWARSMSALAIVSDGSEPGSTYQWKITSSIRGNGTAKAEQSGDGTTYGESFHVIRFSGLHNHTDCGLLAVHANAPGGVLIGPPSDLPISAPGGTRKEGVDSYLTDSCVTTQGNGSFCWVRFDTFSGVILQSRRAKGTASLSLRGRLSGFLDVTLTSKAGPYRIRDWSHFGPDDLDEAIPRTTSPDSDPIPEEDGDEEQPASPGTAGD